MKKSSILLIFMLIAQMLVAQNQPIKKPQYVIIINDEIVSQEKLDKYGRQGDIKSMNKGVSEAERTRLAKKHGDKIGDKEFIIVVSLLSKSDKLAQQRKAKTSAQPPRQLNSVNDFLLRVNQTAKDFTVQMINGETIRLSDLKGKVVLLNFWATWCAPCLMEFHDIPEKILQPFKDKKFVLLPIAIGEGKSKVAKKMARLNKNGVRFNVGYDPQSTIWKQYAKGPIPKNFVIDQQGIIRAVSAGNTPGNLDKLAATIQKLLN